MAKKFYWLLPSNFNSRNGGPFVFDLTNTFRTTIKNKFWNRKITYDRKYTLKEESLEKIRSIKISIFPRTRAFFSLTQKTVEIFNNLFGEMPKRFQHIYNRGNLRTAKSLTIVEIEYDSDIELPENYSEKKEFKPENYYKIDMEFHKLYHELMSVTNEMASLFKLALHFTYLTYNHDFEYSSPQSSGLVVFSNGDKKYYNDIHSDILSHPALIEADRFHLLNERIDMLASIWHKELWTLHRFNKALRSDYLTIDNLLDLVYTMESMFPNNTSTDFMRLAAVFINCEKPAEVQKTELLIKAVFQLRNEVVHGGAHFRITDSYMVNKKDTLIVDIFWQFKFIVIRMMYFAINNFLEQKPELQNSLLINTLDLYSLYYSKKFR